MTEIHPDKIPAVNIPPSSERGGQARPAGQTGILFHELLAERIRVDTQTENSGRPQALPELQGRFDIGTLDLQLKERRMAEDMGKSLDLLETYAACLGNPDKTLKQAHELLRKVAAKTDGLAAAYEADPSLDGHLGKILSQLRTTVEIEKIKFSRGDYVI